MSADGELYVTETCRDCFEKELNDWFGVDEWQLDGRPFSNIWELRSIGDEIEIKVTKDDEEIGKIVIINKFIIVEDDFGDKMVSCEPEKIELREVKDKLRSVIQNKLKGEK